MSQSNLSFEESLANQVLAEGRCVGCGACVLACPFECLEYIMEMPRLLKECKTCGTCAKVCPEYDWPRAEGECFVFGRGRKAGETFGIYRKLMLAQTTDDEVLQAAQNGGVVTGLLRFALENRVIDGAIVSGIDARKLLRPVPRLVNTPEQALECAGTRYFYSLNLFALREAAEQGKQRIAFVGTPCQIRAIRKMQMADMKQHVERIDLTIGLMCSECFDHEWFMDEVHQTLDIDPESILRIGIKGRVQITTAHGTETLPLSKVKNHSRAGCHFCTDFSSELADISAGSLGLDRWTFTVLRTRKGEQLLSQAEKAGILRTRKVEGETEALNLLNRLSREKSRSG
jgi:coenzyme F420 hydrogenase subunit beta